MAYPIGGLGTSILETKVERQRQIALNTTYPVKKVDSRKRISLGWHAFPVASQYKNPSTIISFLRSFKAPKSASIFLRLTLASDLHEHIRIRVFLLGPDTHLGTLDLRYGHPFQPFGLEIPASYHKQILLEGIGLELVQGRTEAWFYGLDAQRRDNLGLQQQDIAMTEYYTQARLYREGFGETGQFCLRTSK